MGPFSPPHMPAQSIAGSSVESSARSSPFRGSPDRVPAHELHEQHACSVANGMKINT